MYQQNLVRLQYIKNPLMFCFITTAPYSEMNLCPAYNTNSNAVFVSTPQKIMEATDNSMNLNIPWCPQTPVLFQNYYFPYQNSMAIYYQPENGMYFAEIQSQRQKKNQIGQFQNLGPINQLFLQTQMIRQTPEEMKVDYGKKNQTKKRKSQTKNLIKNYGRAMLTFIIRNQKFRHRVLEKLKIRDSEFLEEVYLFKNYIHTISAIRYLWQSHPFNKAFRILCCEYLRKYNLKHIFNSRVFKHSVYLKYQDKFMKSLQKPGDFQAIKDT